MRVLKNEVKRKILEVAEEDFLDKGFEATSMREIAQKAEVGLSNIYNYFKNKDEIFMEVLRPLLNAIDKLREDHNKEKFINTNFFNSIELQREATYAYTNLIKKYKKELRILLFKSFGSKLHNFKEEFINKQTRTGVDYLNLMKSKYPEVNIDISPFFIHTMSSWFITIIGEIVSHNLSEEKIERFIEEYISFSTAGWQKIMNVKTE
ncbi:MAG: TetR/AcrR family transcriptional regulator [Candidatus Delongbacteria bacterium]|nr:TetR/AcrR family transcriptional regulator [Candidatus Delongbacteria bacterium]MBN2833463.1 TetR/AcrR family transcriptional regulator [Candidatus Delongbacteria bacterium]